jgi:lysophospholipase L1-like esterase
MTVVSTPKKTATSEKPAVFASALQHRPWWRAAIELPIYAILVIAVLELFLGAAGVGMEQILQPDPEFGTRHIPNKMIVWRMEGFSRGSFNSVGLRDVEHSVIKPAGVYRIALLGDSATEGLQVPLEQTYGAQIQRMYKKPGLRTEVINFACSAYSTGQEVLEFERRVAAYKPDLTILLYNRGDAIENTRKPTDLSGEPRPYFYLDKQGVLTQDDGALQAHAKALQPNPMFDFLRRNSRIYGVLSSADLNLSIHEALYRKLRGWVLKPFSKRMPKPDAEHAPYALQDSWAVTSALIERLNGDCIKAGSKLVVIAFPNVVHDPEFNGQIQNLQQLAKRNSFGCFDLSPTFNTNADPMSLFLQYHFSAKGHKVVAEQINAYLREQK